MTKIDIISGFLGAGKTTLIKKLLNTKLKNEMVVLIENEFGEIGIDSGFLKETKVNITELNQGCICCSLQGDFAKALTEIRAKYNPDRIIIEPSGVGKLSDIVKAVVEAKLSDIEINALVCVCDANKAKMYLKNFGEFYIDQVKHAKTVFLSRADIATPAKMEECLNIVREINAEALIVTTPVDELAEDALLNAFEAKNDDFEKKLLEEVSHMELHHHHHHHDEEDDECECHHHHDEEEHECGCHHHHDEDDHECGCHHHHDEDDHECGCHHHHDEEDHECECHHHHDEEDHECECHRHHHHHHDEGCGCGCGHDHDADEVFTSLGIETTKKFTQEELKEKLETLSMDSSYGMILRSKGIVDGVDGWYHFDMVPGEEDVRHGEAGPIGKLCVIGSDLNEEKIKDLFLK